MLTKMWIGLYLSLVQVVLYIIVVINHDTKYQLVANGTNDFNPGIVCLNIRYSYDKETMSNPQLTTSTCGSSFLSSSMVSLLCLSP